MTIKALYGPKLFFDLHGGGSVRIDQKTFKACRSQGYEITQAIVRQAIVIFSEYVAIFPLNEVCLDPRLLVLANVEHIQKSLWINREILAAEHANIVTNDEIEISFYDVSVSRRQRQVVNYLLFYCFEIYVYVARTT